MKKVVLFGFILLSFSAQAQLSSVPAETQNILKAFTANGQPLPTSFIDSFPLLIHQDILQRRNDFYNYSENKGTCREVLHISFEPDLVKTANPIEQAFLQGLVRIESSKCFGNIAGSELLAIAKESEFKKRAFSTLKKIESEGSKDCEWTVAPGIGRSHYCYNNFDVVEGDIHSVFTFLASNNFESQFNAPVFLRQTLMSTKQIAGQTSLYVISYIRTPPMDTITEFFAKGVIRTTQEKVFSEMLNMQREKRGYK